MFDDIRRRLSLLDVGVSVGTHSDQPRRQVVAAHGRRRGSAEPVRLPARRALARSGRRAADHVDAGGKRDAQWSPDGKEVFYLEQGRINSVNVESRQARAVAVSAEMDVNFDAEKMEVFSQAWRYLADNFADSTMNGVDWAARADALRAAHRRRAHA